MEQEAYRQLPYDVEVEQALLGAVLVDNYSLERVSTTDRKSTRLNSSHIQKSRMPSSA